MKRGIEDRIRTDLDQKMVFLSGPRQVGKTTLSRALYPASSEYFNMDNVEHRLLIQKQAWRRDCDLVIFDGFPEPFLKGSEKEAKRWRRSHVDRILREDLLDIASVRNLRSMETLVELLRNSVGTTISYESLSRDLQISPHTVKQWIGMLG